MSGKEIPELWKVPDVARRLALKERTIRKYVQRRVIPFVKLENELRFDPDEIEQWIEARKKNAAA